MVNIAIFWDASYFWGLLVWRALKAFKVPYQIVTAKEIALDGLSKKVSLCIVPGGTARHKALALGTSGQKKILQWVHNGGHYLGFCGGSGLGLTSNTIDHGIGICPWQRAEIEDRLHHMISGYVPVLLHKQHQLIPSNINKLILPVWWPGRFAVPKNTLGVDVLASYSVQSLEDCQKSLCVADLSLSLLSEQIVHEWLEVYGVDVVPSFLDNQPCIISGNSGKGSYVLSYSHLETPNALEANLLFAHIIKDLTGVVIENTCIPEWNYREEPIVWDDSILVSARSDMDALFQLGIDQGLLFHRTPWLIGWRSGVPGMALNNIQMALCVIMSKKPTEDTYIFWEKSCDTFRSVFKKFQKSVETFLLTQRLAGLAHYTVSLEKILKQKVALFGTAMESKGIYRELLSILDELIVQQLRKGSTV